MTYIGTDIIREYKGYKIIRKTNVYFGTEENHYTVDGKIFTRLKDAKKYVDRKVGNSQK